MSCSAAGWHKTPGACGVSLMPACSSSRTVQWTWCLLVLTQSQMYLSMASILFNWKMHFGMCFFGVFCILLLICASALLICACMHSCTYVWHIPIHPQPCSPTTLFIHNPINPHTPHREYRIPVKGVLHPGRNSLELVFHSAITESTNRAHAYPYKVPSMQGPGMLAHYNFLRKPACDFGWDWYVCVLVCVLVILVCMCISVYVCVSVCMYVYQCVLVILVCMCMYVYRSVCVSMWMCTSLYPLCHIPCTCHSPYILAFSVCWCSFTM